MSGSKVLPRVDSPILPAQPLAVHELRTGKVNGATGAAEPLHSLAIRGICDIALTHQGA